jgi:hypothetical protein
MSSPIIVEDSLVDIDVEGTNDIDDKADEVQGSFSDRLKQLAEESCILEYSFVKPLQNNKPLTTQPKNMSTPKRPHIDQTYAGSQDEVLSCWKLSGETRIAPSNVDAFNLNLNSDFNVIKTSQNIPSQAIRPAESLSQAEKIDHVAAEKNASQSVPLSIPNHIDDYGSLKNLSRVVFGTVKNSLINSVETQQNSVLVPATFDTHTKENLPVVQNLALYSIQELSEGTLNNTSDTLEMTINETAVSKVISSSHMIDILKEGDSTRMEHTAKLSSSASVDINILQSTGRMEGPKEDSTQMTQVVSQDQASKFEVEKIIKSYEEMVREKRHKSEEIALAGDDQTQIVEVEFTRVESSVETEVKNETETKIATFNEPEITIVDTQESDSVSISRREKRNISQVENENLAATDETSKIASVKATITEEKEAKKYLRPSKELCVGDLIHFRRNEFIEKGFISAIAVDYYAVGQISKERIELVHVKEIDILLSEGDVNFNGEKTKVLENGKQETCDNLKNTAKIEASPEFEMLKREDDNVFEEDETRIIAPVPTRRKTTKKSVKSERSKQKSKRTSPTGKSPASVSTRSQKIPTSMNTSHIFEGFLFVITGLSSTESSRPRSPQKSQNIIKLIRDNGGYILNTDEDLDKQWSRKAITNKVLISEKACRTTKYFLALAAGIPKIHSSWITECVKQLNVLPFEKYQLPNGTSTITGETVDYKWKDDLLQGKTVYLIIQDMDNAEKVNTRTKENI